MDGGLDWNGMEGNRKKGKGKKEREGKGRRKGGCLMMQLSKWMGKKSEDGY